MERLDTNITGLALRVGVSQASMSDWVNGKTRPTPANVTKLARVLGVHPIDVVAAVYEIDIPGDLSERERATLDLLIRLGEEQQETLLGILDVFRAQEARSQETGTPGSAPSSPGDGE